jgi:hypothetical protein
MKNIDSKEANILYEDRVIGVVLVYKTFLIVIFTAS